MKTDKIIEEKIIKLTEDNKISISQIAEKLNIKYSTAYCVCKRLKLKTEKIKQGGLNVIDITGKRFGSLIVLKRSNYSVEYSKTAWWTCKCSCGNICDRNGIDLRLGKTKTCGCKISIVSRRNWQGCGDIPKRKWQIINQNAKQRSIEFKITIEYCDEIFKKQNSKCYLTGLDISFKDNTASLDRIDNNQGYIEGNVAWCHKDINNMKQKFSKERFIELCKRVSDFVN